MNPFLNSLQQAQHELWIGNLETLLEFLEGLKDDSVDLGSFNKMEGGELQKPNIEHTCGSVACIGGWVAVMPYFKELGIKREKDGGAPQFPSSNTFDGVESASMFLFGVSDMFDSRFDDEDEGKHADKTDREIAIRRVKKRLKAVSKLEKKRFKNAQAAE